jgi:hypothetical protein
MSPWTRLRRRRLRVAVPAAVVRDDRCAAVRGHLRR